VIVSPLERLELERGVHLGRLRHCRAGRHLLRGLAQHREPVIVDGDHRAAGDDEDLWLGLGAVALEQLVLVRLR